MPIDEGCRMNRCNEQKMELEELKRKLEIKERQIVDLQQESAQLVEQRDALASKYTKLKGHVMQIQVRFVDDCVRA